MIPVCQPTIDASDHKAIAEVLDSRWLSMGSVVERFEAALCEETGYPYAVAVSSCTAALALSIRALRLGPGALVNVPALTFTATAAAVEHAGAQVWFRDVDPETWQMVWPERASHQATIPVALYGQPVNREAIRNAEAQKAYVIEDAAHAFGAALNPGAAVCCLSFYATKNITTAGEGGAVLTRDEAVAEYVRAARCHGLSAGAWQRHNGFPEYRVRSEGFKANMSDLQAAMGLSQLRRLKFFRERRAELAEVYDAALPMLQRPARSSAGIVHLYPVLLPPETDRSLLIAAMRDLGIGLGIHYRALTQEPYWAARYPEASCPVAESIGERAVSLPLYPHLSDRDQQMVINNMRGLLSL